MTSPTSAAIGGASALGAASAAVAPSGKDMSQRFLTLLVAQMKNQNPLKPMDNSEVTSQIAQINTVSGINDLNRQLAAINGQISTSQQMQASALIGHKVLVPGDRISVGDNGAATAFGIDLPKGAAKLTLTIVDKTGAVMHQSSYQDQAAGVQSFSWDGKNAKGNVVGPGAYTLHVQAEDVDGSPIAVKTLATGYVGGVVAGDSGPELDLGPNGLVGLSDVYQII